jgi:hypothetical protein
VLTQDTNLQTQIRKLIPNPSHRNRNPRKAEVPGVVNLDQKSIDERENETETLFHAATVKVMLKTRRMPRIVITTTPPTTPTTPITTTIIMILPRNMPAVEVGTVAAAEVHLDLAPEVTLNPDRIRPAIHPRKSARENTGNAESIHAQVRIPHLRREV